MLPERFGRYEVLAEIGEGAMGRVYSAWDPRVSRLVAVKAVRAELLTSETAAEYLKRFRREAQAAGSLNHPQVVRVFDIGDDFLVMEHVEGRTLQALIRAAGRIEPAEALRLLGPVADALDHAHRAGIVHRDIKPANVIVQPDGQPKLMDFGVAHLAASVMTTAGQILGSPSYMAPEQIAGLEVTGRADVYSLAVVAYEMLTGRPPFQGRTITQVIYSVMHETPAPPRRLNAALPARYDDVLARGLAKDPSLRFARAGELVAALDLRELELALTPIEPEPEPPAGEADAATLLHAPAAPRAAGARSRPLVWSLAAATAMALTALGWAAVQRRPADSAPPAAAAREATAREATAHEAADAAPHPKAPPRSPAPSVSPRAARRAAVERPIPEARPDQLLAGTDAAPPPVLAGELVALTDDVTPPVLTRGGAAPYPEAARALRQHGSVTVSMIVDETGAPTELRVVESAGAVLDQAVLDAVRRWRFEPARKDGVPVKVRWSARQTYRGARP
jgi:serine/threonine-protein kinase